MAAETITGTIAVPNLEEAIVALIRFGQLKERDDTANPGAANRITSSTDEDELIFSAQINIPCSVVGDVITVPDYLTGVTFSAATATLGTFTKWTQALAELTIELAKIQALPARNPAGTIGISSWELRNAAQGQGTATLNATFNASYRMPLVESVGSNGALTTKGKEFTN